MPICYPLFNNSLLETFKIVGSFQLFISLANLDLKEFFPQLFKSCHRFVSYCHPLIMQSQKVCVCVCVPVAVLCFPVPFERWNEALVSHTPQLYTQSIDARKNKSIFLNSILINCFRFVAFSPTQYLNLSTWNMYLYSQTQCKQDSNRIHELFR